MMASPSSLRHLILLFSAILLVCDSIVVVLKPASAFSVRSFTARSSSTKKNPHPPPTSQSNFPMSAVSSSLSALPVGIATSLSTSIKAGPYGVLALSAIASMVLLPITQIRNLYGITIGYGLSVAAMGYALRSTFAPSALGNFLTISTIAYGIRLAGYLYLRQVTGYKPSRKRDDPPRIKRIPFAMSLALFYACMTCPVLYVLRAQPLLSTTGWRPLVAWIGAVVAPVGVILEAVADAQKMAVKMRTKSQDNSNNNGEFKGPTGGVYSLTRHPNYTGELLFWSGLYVAGIAAFDKSIVGWLCSSAGVYGIVTIMRTATKGLENRQQEKYGGQEAYETWKGNVKAPLIPFLTSKPTSKKE